MGVSNVCNEFYPLADEDTGTNILLLVTPFVNVNLLQ